MKICIIRPSVIHKELALSHMPSAPIGPAYIASVLRQHGHDVQVIDAPIEGFNNVEKFIMDTYIYGLNPENTILMADEDTEVFCISFMFTNNWYFDRELVKEAKKRFPNSIIIGGGEHATAVPKYCFDTAPGLDFIVMGEGEATVVELMDAIEKEETYEEINSIVYKRGEELIINRGKKVKRILNISQIPWPAWDLFPLDKYFDNKISYGVYRGNSLPIMASRGCPYECTFCSNPIMWGRQYTLRDISDFLDELEFWNKNYNVVNFDFYDLTAVIKRQWIIDMCDELEKRNLKITYQIPAGTRAEAIDFEVASKLFKTGCKNITYAPESGSVKVLKDIKKKVKLSVMYYSIACAYKAGMNVKLNIIVGMPGETHKDVWLTIWFLIRSSWIGVHDMYPAIFSPYPGSVLFDSLTEQGEVDIYSDEYIAEIINSHDLWPGKTYNASMKSFYIKLYSVIMYFVFYGTNFLFRPQRIFQLLKNIYTGKHESRSELVLAQTLFKFKRAKEIKKEVA